MIVGAEGESERDYDFLASIEVVILDQAEVFLMQVVIISVFFFFLFFPPALILRFFPLDY